MTSPCSCLTPLNAPGDKGPPTEKRKKKGPNRRQLAIKMLPDTSRGEKPLHIPLESTLEDDWWKKHGLWAITTSNPKSWASAAANVTNKASDDVVLLQETKTFRESAMKVCGNTARRQGWNHCFGFAHRTSGTMGSGGCAVLAKRGTGISDRHNRTVSDLVSHRATVAWISAIAKGGFHLISIYLKGTVGMNPENTSWSANTCVPSFGASKALASSAATGTWNRPHWPDSGFLGMVRGTIFGPELPTCSGKVFDYFRGHE